MTRRRPDYRDNVIPSMARVRWRSFAGLREDKDARTVIKEHGGEA